MTVEISELLNSGESEIIEFKESFGEESLETIVAFANSSGGTLLIGVKDNGDVCGYPVGKKTLEEIANRIQETTDPRLQPSISLVNYAKDKLVVVIRIEPRSGIPASVRGRFMRRVGRTNQRMSHDEIIQKMQSTGRAYWDEAIENRATLSDLSEEKISDFLNTVRNHKRQPVPKSISDLDALTQMQLVRNGKPTRAAILLFCNDPKRFYPGATVRVGRFRSEIHIVDDKQIEGTLFDQVEATMLWFRDKLATEYVISGKPQRDVIWEYPLEAIREGLVNAVCHRTYTETSQIQVRLYDDRLEIWNSGSLIQPLKSSDLLIQHESIPRNNLVAGAFFNANLIEKWGTGTLRMIDLMRVAKLADPIFDVSHAERFRLIFPKKFIGHEEKTPKLNTRQIQAILFCKTNGKITNPMYQENFTVSKRTASRELKALVDLRELVKKGATGAGTYYEIPSPDERGHKGAIKGPRNEPKNTFNINCLINRTEWGQMGPRQLGRFLHKFIFQNRNEPSR